jgi:hypothetical protein
MQNYEIFMNIKYEQRMKSGCAAAKSSKVGRGQHGTRFQNKRGALRK